MKKVLSIILIATVLAGTALFAGCSCNSGKNDPDWDPDLDKHTGVNFTLDDYRQAEGNVGDKEVSWVIGGKYHTYIDNFYHLDEKCKKITESGLPEKGTIAEAFCTGHTTACPECVKGAGDNLNENPTEATK